MGTSTQEDRRQDKLVAQVREWEEANGWRDGFASYLREQDGQELLSLIRADGDEDGVGVDKESRRVRGHWVTKREVDRVGDIVVPEGVNLRFFRRNPVVLANHVPLVPVGRSLSQRVEEDGIRADTEFHTLTREAEEWGAMVMEGIIRGWSIGFSVVQARELTDEDAEGLAVTNAPRRFGLLFEKTELMEYSSTAIPAVRGALTEAMARGKMVTSRVLKHVLQGWDDPDPKLFRGMDFSPVPDLAIHELELNVGAIRAREDEYLEPSVRRALEGLSRGHRILAIEVERSVRFPDSGVAGSYVQANWGGEEFWGLNPQFDQAGEEVCWQFSIAEPKDWATEGCKLVGLSAGVGAWVVADSSGGNVGQGYNGAGWTSDDLLCHLAGGELERQVPDPLQDAAKGGGLIVLDDGVYRFRVHKSGTWEAMLQGGVSQGVATPGERILEYSGEVLARLAEGVFRVEGLGLPEDVEVVRVGAESTRGLVQLVVRSREWDSVLDGDQIPVLESPTIARVEEGDSWSVKAGRVLSSRNASKLVRARDLLTEILDSAKLEEDNEGDQGSEGGKAAGSETGNGNQNRPVEGEEVSSSEKGGGSEISGAGVLEALQSLMEERSQGEGDRELGELATKLEGSTEAVSKLEAMVAGLQRKLRVSMGRVD